MADPTQKSSFTLEQIDKVLSRLAQTPGSGPLTAADVDAVSKSGDTMTGNLVMQGANVTLHKRDTTGGWAQSYSMKTTDGSKTLAALGFFGDGDTMNHVYIGFDGNYQAHNTFAISKNAVKFMDKVVFHQGNKPSGTYTGNGGASVHTIDTKGVGNLAIIRNHSKGLVFVFDNQCYGYPLNGSAFQSSNVTFKNGILTVNTASEYLNAVGETYTWVVP